MAEVIKMPRMSDTMEEGNIVAWHKKVGDEVEIGDLLAEIETDKATMDFESPADGVLLHIAVTEGAIPIGAVLAVIGEAGENFQAAINASSDDAAASAAENKEEAPTAEPKAERVPEPTGVPQPQAEHTPVAPGNDRIKASPLARKMAKDSGIGLNEVSGTGENGRIVKRDIETYLRQADRQQATPAAPQAAPSVKQPAKVAAPVVSTNANHREIPLSQMRKVIARRLGESKFSAPHFYLTVAINMDKAIAARKQINEIAPTKISFNDLVVKSVAAALQQHPAVNSSWMGDHIRENKDVNIGVAVAVPDGLLVPVIHHANAKTLSQINMEVRELAGKARERKLQPQEMQGNTFTISNLGMFGIEEFTAIINPPDACILAVGGIIPKAIVKDGELAVGSMMKVTMSCDHRVVDGATGAQFLNTLKGILEDPIRMLV